MVDRAIDAMNKQTEAQVATAKIEAELEREHIAADKDQTRLMVGLFGGLALAAALIALLLVLLGHSSDGVGLFRESLAAVLGALATAGFVRSGSRRRAGDR